MKTNELELLSRELNLGRINPSLHNQAREAFLNGDEIGFLTLADNTAALALVLDNIMPLRNRGIYEVTLLDAWRRTRRNHFNFTTTAIEHLFEMADREKLLAAGDPLPDGDRIVVYRGVAGVGRARRVSTGYSWSTDVSQACWFATRGRHADPAVYRATVSRSEILAYDNQRNEQEIICRPTRIKRMPLAMQEMADRAQEITQEIKRREQEGLRCYAR